MDDLSWRAHKIRKPVFVENTLTYFAHLDYQASRQEEQ